MNPWKDDGIQIYNYQWVMDGTDKNNIHHTWDYTLQTTKVDTSPELTAVFPKSVVPGKKYSVKLTSTKNGKDVTNCTFYTSLTEGLSIDSATRTISWTQTDKGPKEVKLIREFGNARDTIVNSLGFGTTTINSFTIGTESSIGVKNSGSHYIVHINRLPFSGHAPVIQVLTLNGKIIGEKRIVNPKESSITINKNNLAPGVYLLNISDGKRLHTEKLVF
jgi:hypothetical protein